MEREFSAVAELIALDHDALDITDQAEVRRVVLRAAPDVVINCAAYNDVDGAEEHPERAIDVNALGVLALMRATSLTGSTLVHFSTDFVFDGESTRPYVEVDRACPRSVYGQSKLLGDWFALEQPLAFVLRVESLFGLVTPGRPARGSLAGIVSRVKAGKTVPVFVDRVVSPTHTADIARATRELLARRAAPGLYHCVNTGAATWAQIALEVARVLEVPLHMQEMTLKSAPLVAPRPRYCALSNAKLLAAGVAMPTWQEALRQHLRSQ